MQKMELLFMQIKIKNFFDVVQPNDDFISKELSAGTLSFEFSIMVNKILQIVVRLKAWVQTLNILDIVLHIQQ